MKRYIAVVGLAGMLLTAGSCRKDDTGGYEESGPRAIRKVRYELFTKADNSTNEETIRFDLVMRKGAHVLFDSALAPMKIKDIPDSLHPLVFEKTVPEGIRDTIVASFDYDIENVGHFWYLEPFPAGDTLKILRFSFD
jgi:hypothetical protein